MGVRLHTVQLKPAMFPVLVPTTIRRLSGANAAVSSWPVVPWREYRSTPVRTCQIPAAVGLLAGAVAVDPLVDFARQYGNWNDSAGATKRKLARREVGGTPSTAADAFAARSPLD